MEDDIGEQAYSTCHVFLSHRRVVGRVLLVGEGIEVTTHTLQFVKDVGSLALWRSLEGNMLTEVGQSFLAIPLMA